MKKILLGQEKILKTLAGKADGYCLGGGTALSRVYFQHRFSFDLDFFMLHFDRAKILSLVEFLSHALKKDIDLVSEISGAGRVQIMVFSAVLSKKESIKIDFIEDCVKRIKPPKEVDGIYVFALEDIYLRKIYTVAGSSATTDNTGRTVNVGGRHEAKDFFDLYFLSHTFMNLSNFSATYCGMATQEALIRWFRIYSRMDIKTGLLELKTKNKIDYKTMENHFNKEVGRILEKQIGRV